MQLNMKARPHNKKPAGAPTPTGRKVVYNKAHTTNYITYYILPLQKSQELI